MMKKEKYDAWKVNYQADRKLEKRKSVILYLSIISSLLLIFYISRFFIQGKHVFWGHETTIIVGKVEKVAWRHWGKGYFRQIAYYSYDFNGKTYHDKSKVGSLKYMMSSKTKYVDDEIFLKISKSSPEKNRVIK